jgi:acyl-CoA reductase-like NAD-dependent aldehyde dehydrogenase
MISFTGSTRIGKQIVRDAAGTVKRVALELGGKAANIVFADADIEAALDGVLFGFTLNQGQECIAGARLLVEASIAPMFLDELASRTNRLRVGLPLDENADISSLIHEAHLESVKSHVDFALEEGAQLLTGGNRLAGEFAEGFFYAPTILTNVGADSKIFRDEVFGPVLTVTTFETIDEAVRLANDTIYGLANGLWTKDVDKALTISRQLRSGTVFVNTYLETAPQLPFGGFKQSGLGRENGLDGLLEFTEIKSTIVKLGPRIPVLGHTTGEDDLSDRITDVAK